MNQAVLTQLAKAFRKTKMLLDKPPSSTNVSGQNTQISCRNPAGVRFFDQHGQGVKRLLA